MPPLPNFTATGEIYQRLVREGRDELRKYVKK